MAFTVRVPFEKVGGASYLAYCRMDLGPRHRQRDGSGRVAHIVVVRVAPMFV